MRAVILGLASLFIAGDAMAADYLRGSTYDPPAAAAGYSWSGIYAGVQWGRSQADTSFAPYSRTEVTDPLIRPTPEPVANLTLWPELNGAGDSGSGYGGFVGYNSQWGDVVIGLELNYNRTSLSPSSTRRVVVDIGGGVLGVTDYGGQFTLNDYASLRFRMGYAWGWIMPYTFVGAAAGRADTVRTATVSFIGGAPPPTLLPYTDVEAKNNAVVFGYVLGGGVDIGITSNVFLRGEYEFLQLSALRGMTTQVSTFRVGAGVKF